MSGLIQQKFSAARVALVMALVGLAAGCAGSSEKPDAALAKAQASIDSAEKTGGREYGSVDLDLAREKYTLAKQAAEDGSEVRAIRLAEQAAVDAELAGAKGASGRSSVALKELQDSAQSLHEEVQRRSPTDAPVPGPTTGTQEVTP